MAWVLAIFVAGPMVLAEQADTVTLRNGDVLTGQLEELTKDHVTLLHPVLGKLVIPLDQVDEIVPSTMDIEQIDADLDHPPRRTRSKQDSSATQPAEQAATSPAKAPTTQPTVVVIVVPTAKKTPAEPPVPKSWFDGWKSKLILRFDGRSRDSTGRDELTGRGGFETDRKTPDDRWKFDGSLRFDDHDNASSRLRYEFGGLHDQYFNGSPWSLQVRGRFEYDRGQEWDYRATGDASMGYDVVDTKTLTATVRGGLGLVQEIGDQAQPLRPEGLVGAELTWKITPTQELTGRTDFLPDLTDTSSYRVVSSLTWQIKVKQTDQMSFRLGAENEYASNPRGDGSRNTLHYFGAVVFEF
ncbi:MAG: DUF481 domain-containing protein [Phycisphaeraceae bacterium]|nr:DUF481 domain-containing protein [Phycisphaeraceae bacterium]